MWGAIASAVAPSLIGGLLGSSSSGGGTQTVSKDPWAPAQDWMKSNITNGQNLQAQYAANPFSAYQQQAYGNQRNLSQNAQSILAGYIPQMSGHQGFDRSNPMQRPQAMQMQMPQMQALQTPPANFGMGDMGPSVSAVAPVPAPVAAANVPSFSQQMADYLRQKTREGRDSTTTGGGGR